MSTPKLLKQTTQQKLQPAKSIYRVCLYAWGKNRKTGRSLFIFLCALKRSR
jgi:hypothetical protein